MVYEYNTQNTCAKKIIFDYDGSIITNVDFSGGCNGNLKAVSKLVNGMTPEKIAEILSGNTCGYKNTSCADQLAKAVLKAAEQK